MQDLGTLGGYYSAAVAINDRGEVIGTSQTASGQDHTVLWSDGTVRDLTAESGFQPTSGISARGQIAERIGNQAAVWDETGAHLLAGGASSTPSAVSDRGDVVGTGCVAGTGRRRLRACFPLGGRRDAGSRHSGGRLAVG